ncbi:hypothetical protein [Pseudodesulfovibrio sediminis]|uniref:Uncharacterized protein n=1 Tax=Pseudodesulfovibrio sediminis TaxID=2810563 RepID=A0ABN6ENZ0_9BACT|nr:hypothetical protein [Pseudodesulfovibrio sediminis]BCS86781.1 hypothetical protein PSDVSF_00230 [Pseudodesulfovibrio sediminis]
MLYVPIKIYSDRRSLKGCLARAAVCLVLAVVGFHFINDKNIRLAVYSVSMVGFGVTMLNGIAVTTKQPMIKVLDDRFSIYTPFGYAVIRFGEVLAFRTGRVPFFRTLRVQVNRSAKPRFPSTFGRLLYTVTSLHFASTVSIQGFMLGADVKSVVNMLEKRRLTAVRLEAVGGYDSTALTPAS